MHSLRFLLPLVSALLIATLGLAQPSQPTAPSPQIGAGEWITQSQPDQWQASNLEGLMSTAAITATSSAISVN